MAEPMYTGIILNANSLYADTPSISFSIPQVNNIRIISPDWIVGSLRIYYGDEIDLKFWRMLNLKFGAVPNPENPLTRIDDYLYVYHHRNRTFDAYDDNGVNFVHIDNVDNIAKMNIDFTIANSHQFEIIADSSAMGWTRFIFPVIWNKRTFDAEIQTNLAQGVFSPYPPNKVRPYEADDPDNPEFYIKYLGGLDLSTSWEEFYYRLAERFYPNDEMWAIGKANAPDWTKNMPTNYFYVERKDLYSITATQIHYWPDLFEPTKCYKAGSIVRVIIEGYGDTQTDNIFAVMANSSCGTCIENGQFNENGTNGISPFNVAINDTSRVFNAVIGKSYRKNDIILYNGIYYLVIEPFIFTDFEIDKVNLIQICTLLKRLIRRTIANKQEINPLFPDMPITLYPKYMPVERAGETHNNRPVYEPWLIWPFGFIVTYWTMDDDEEMIPVFDLSPRWL